MKCPICGSINTTVKDSRLDRGSRVRKYLCLDCGGKFRTREVWEKDQKAASIINRIRSAKK